MLQARVMHAEGPGQVFTPLQASNVWHGKESLEQASGEE
jgi:hypothetical protein